jgi:two-component system, NarL family, invasion response regulator UvrY
MIRVVIVDDHTMVRKALGHLIGAAGDIEIIAEADSGEAALDLFRTLTADVVLCDIFMPGIGGMETIRRLHQRFTDLGIVAVTAEIDVSLARHLLEEGVDGYVTKDAPPEELISAIRHAARKDRFVSSRIAREIALSSTRKEQTDPFATLSSREEQVLMMILEGKNNQCISDVLCVSPKTVSTYKLRIHEKLGVTNDIELFRLAMRNGRVAVEMARDFEAN